MTSFGAEEVREPGFMPTFKVCGQIIELVHYYQWKGMSQNFCRSISWAMTKNKLLYVRKTFQIQRKT